MSGKDTIKPTIWLTSDTHFNHKKIIYMGKGRPENFQEKIIKSIKQIKEGDTLIHLGDICIGGDKQIHEFIKNLKIKKILIKGNHDKQSNSWYIRNGWDFVCHETVIKEEGKLILLKHIPIGKESAQQIDIHIHGHSHGNMSRLTNRKEQKEYVLGGIYDPTWHYDVAPDLHNYQVISLDSIIKNINKLRKDL